MLKKNRKVTHKRCPPPLSLGFSKSSFSPLNYVQSHLNQHFSHFVSLRGRNNAFWNLKLGFSVNFPNCLSSSHICLQLSSSWSKCRQSTIFLHIWHATCRQIDIFPSWMVIQIYLFPEEILKEKNLALRVIQNVRKTIGASTTASIGPVAPQSFHCPKFQFTTPHLKGMHPNWGWGSQNFRWDT